MAAMKSARLRLVLSIVLFAGWMGWLASRAISDKGRHDIVGPPGKGYDRKILSRAQFLVANFIIKASIDQFGDSASPVRIVEVVLPAGEEKLVDKTITIANLAECKDSWAGPGVYIVPIMTDWKNDYRVPPIPRSPGSPDPKTMAGRPRIYVDSPETREQLNQIK
jgi:hypothetical protein